MILLVHQPIKTDKTRPKARETPHASQEKTTGRLSAAERVRERKEEIRMGGERAPHLPEAVAREVERIVAHARTSESR